MENQGNHFDKNIFYCITTDDTQFVVVAKSEDEIQGAKLVVSLDEVDRIRAILLEAKAALKVTPPLEQRPDSTRSV